MLGLSFLGTKFYDAIRTFYVGHNLPDHVVIDFFNHHQEQQQRYRDDENFGLSSHESYLLNSLLSKGLIMKRSYPNKKENKKRCSYAYHLVSPFYVIGSVVGDYATKNHEMSHALYRLCLNYRSHVMDLYLTMTDPESTKVEFCLNRRGYVKDLHEDEYGAYVLENDKEMVKLSGITPSEINTLKQSFADSQKKISTIVIDTSSYDADQPDTPTQRQRLLAAKNASLTDNTTASQRKIKKKKNMAAKARGG